MKKVLIIDDDEAIRKSFILALEATGYRVDTAESGEKGLECVYKERYDLVFLDLKMPGLNGVETLGRIRERYEELPVYIITAFYGEFFDELKSLKEKGVGFELMKKPVGIDEIVIVTQSIMEGPRGYE